MSSTALTNAVLTGSSLSSRNQAGAGRVAHSGGVRSGVEAGGRGQAGQVGGESEGEVVGHPARPFSCSRAGSGMRWREFDRAVGADLVRAVPRAEFDQRVNSWAT